MRNPPKSITRRHTIPKTDAERLRRRMAVHCDPLPLRQACGEDAWCTLEGLGDGLPETLIVIQESGKAEIRKKAIRQSVDELPRRLALTDSSVRDSLLLGDICTSSLVNA